MESLRGARGLVLGAMATALVGCAPAYHWYEGCRVPCKYCVPCPLPYQPYEGCPCHSRAADRHLSVTTALLTNPLEPRDDGGGAAETR